MVDQTSETPRPDPAPAARNPERIQERAYESDWAGLPADETDGQLDPGAGPVGSVGASGRSVPLTTIAVGFGLLFLTFLLDNPVPLMVGLLLIVVGGVWSGLTERRAGTMHGVGTLDARLQRKRGD
jgi:hypothetical protein